MCPPLESSVLVHRQRYSNEGQTYSRSLECDSGQVVQAPTSDSEGVVPVSRSVQSIVLQMGPTTDRSVCYPLQPQTSQVCITGTGSSSLGSRNAESPLGEPTCLLISSNVTTQQGSFQGDGSGVSQDDLDCAKVAQHVLVLGPVQSGCSDSLCAPTTGGYSDTTLKRVSSQ